VTAKVFASRSPILVGLVGSGIEHSRSPALHMDEASALGVQLMYRLFDLDLRPRGPGELPGILDEAQSEGYAGLNITYPCKQSVLQFLDALSVEAEALQAVNTVVFKDGRRIGHNTDWWGFAESFRRGLPNVTLHHVVQFGAGGAGAAVAYAAAKLGVKQLSLIDREPDRAEALATRLRVIAPLMQVEVEADVERAISAADGLIHATPVGMAKSPGIAFPPNYLRPALWVAEVVYVPLQTQLLEAAGRMHCRTLDGGGMAVFQAAAAFALFTGIEPNAERMRQSFLDKLHAEPVPVAFAD
jgi:shikimate dehydrogenase